MKMYKKILIEIILAILILVGFAMVLPNISNADDARWIWSNDLFGAAEKIWYRENGLDRLYINWTNVTFKNGSIEEYALAGSNRTLALYCVNHSNSIGNYEDNEYRTAFHITIKGNKAEIQHQSASGNVDEYYEYYNTANGLMAYILNEYGMSSDYRNQYNILGEDRSSRYIDVLTGARNESNFGYGTSTANRSYRQLLVWHVWNAWMQGILDVMPKDSYPESWDQISSMQDQANTELDSEIRSNTNARNLLTQATTWANENNNNLTKVSPTGSEMTTDYDWVGPFNFTFNGSLAVKLYDTSGNEITNIQLTDANKNVISSVSSGQAFYIRNLTSSIPGSMTVTENLSNSDIACVDLYVLEGIGTSSNYMKQSLIIVNTYFKTAESKSLTVKLNCNVYTNLVINKTDSDTKEKISGIGFTIVNNANGQYITSSGGQTSTRTVLYTNSNGQITINNINITTTLNATFTVTEVASNNSYYQSNSSVTQTQTVVKNGTVTFNLTNIKPYKLTIQKLDNNNTALNAGFKIQYEDGTWLSGSTSNVTYGSTATEFFTSGGTLTLNKIKRGTYHIYETSVSGEAFDLSDQDGYDSSNGWVDCGTVTVGSTSSNVTVTKNVINIPNIIITGYVWLDENANKIGTYNGVYDGPDSEWSGEVRVNGVTVNLRRKSNNSIIATTTTKTIDGNDGCYEFRYIINYNEVDDYYIEFDYSGITITNGEGETRPGTEYIPVEFNSQDANSLVTNGSRALMDEVAEYDVNLDGIATTYTGTNASLETTYGLSGNIFDEFYNPSTYTLSYINLGLLEIYDPSYTISEDLEYVQIVYNDYVYTYEYGEAELYDATTAPIPTPTVNFQDDTDIYLYTRSFYPSDLYQWAQDEVNNTLDVYVVYGITVVNTTAYNVPIRYTEQTLHIESLTNEFDSYRYELCTDYSSASYFDTGSDELTNQINSDIRNNWTNSQDNGDGTATTTYTSEFDVDYGSPVTKYIQFEVTRDAKRDILNLAPGEGIYEQNPTRATTQGYHRYLRNDWSWDLNIYGENQSHISRTKEAIATAGYLVFTLDNETGNINRTVTGTVFRDDIEDRSVDGEKLGNGYKDDNEYSVENVLVELIDISTGNIATIYEYDETSGTHINEKEAITVTDENGDYTFEGVVPGEYYIRYTYGTWENTEDDGSTSNVTSQIVVSDDEKIDVSIDDYKSTIVTAESAKEALKDKQAGEEGDDEWYKYLNENGEDIDYSVAVDDLDIRSDYNTSGTDSEGNEITSIISETADMSITIENTTENQGDGNTHEELTRISFGIVEQQEQIVEIDKIITNVSLVNTPTVIFNGNPETDSISGVSDLDGETNGGSSYTRVEISEDNIYGSELTITYTVTITNVSDLNYYETSSEYQGWYYMYGEVIEGVSKEIQIDIQELLDIYDPSLIYDSTIENIENVTCDGFTTDADGNNIIIWVDSENNEYDSKEELVLAMEDLANTAEPDRYSFDERGREGLIIENLGKIVRIDVSSSATRIDSVSSTYSLTKVISTQEEDMGYMNTVGITEVENAISDEDESSGNRDIARYTLSLAKATQVSEPSEAYITISPPTGADRITPIYYISVGVVVLAVLAVGIVIIKKKVL